MKETRVSLNEAKRRSQQAAIEARQLKLENARRLARGEEPLKKIKTEDEEPAIPHTADKPKPEEDAYLAETGHILLDYLTLESRLARH